MQMHVQRGMIVFFGFFLFFAHLALSQGRGINIVSYDIDAKILPRGDAIELTATCGMQKADTTMQTQLLLSSSCKSLTIQAMASGGWTEIRSEFVGKDTLQLRFPKTMRQAGSIAMKFRYTFPINPLGDSLLLLDRGSRWYPLIADQIATMRLRCEVPGDYTVLSAGDLLETKVTGAGRQFVWETTLPIFKLPLVVFKSNTLKRDSLQVLQKKILLYHSPAVDSATASILSESGKLFSFFTDVLGEYPYRSLTLVEVPYFEGVDVSSGLLMVGSPTIRFIQKGYFDPLRLTVAEQWIGAGVIAKFRQPGFWFFTISVPHYLRLMYVRHSEGEAAYKAALQRPLKQYEEFAGKENDVPILDVDFPNSREKGLVLYAKGPLVVGRLEMHFGNEKWKALLRDLYREYLGKILTYDDFRSIVAKHDKSDGGVTLLNELMTQKGISPK
jgi:hypothetical protein